LKPNLHFYSDSLRPYIRNILFSNFTTPTWHRVRLGYKRNFRGRSLGWVMDIRLGYEHDVNLG